MIPVSSSNLKAIAYDTLHHILTIEFHNGSIYEYYNVPPHIYEGLLYAPSKGKYHHRYIKNNYPYKRIK